MPPSRDDDAQTIATLERALHEARCERIRLAEEIEHQEAKIRSLTRAIDRLTHKETPCPGA
jgi:septal ring factor EnvC (AmiA/AmiB activator)